MYKLADYAYDVKGARKLSIFYLNDEFGQESAKHFEDRFAQRGGTIIITENFAPSDNDFRTQITKLKEKVGDGIFMMSYGTWLVNQLKQMDELGLKTQFYGPVPVEDTKLLQVAGALAESIIYPYPDENPKTSKQIEFDKKYLANYNTPGELYARIGYDTFTVLWNAVKKCGKDKECIKRELSQLQNYDGAGGVLSVDAEGVGKRTILLKQIQNGAFIPLP